MKLLVTGRRDFADKARIHEEIAALAPAFVIDYDARGKSAEPKRIKQVLAAEAPDKVLCFSVGPVAAVARDLGIEVVEVTE